MHPGSTKNAFLWWKCEGLLQQFIGKCRNTTRFWEICFYSIHYCESSIVVLLYFRVLHMVRCYVALIHNCSRLGMRFILFLPPSSRYIAVSIRICSDNIHSRLLFIYVFYNICKPDQQKIQNNQSWNEQLVNKTIRWIHLSYLLKHFLNFISVNKDDNICYYGITLGNHIPST